MGKNHKSQHVPEGVSEASKYKNGQGARREKEKERSVGTISPKKLLALQSAASHSKVKNRSEAKKQGEVGKWPSEHDLCIGRVYCL